jgi:pyruvate,water dikinase
LTPEDIGSFEVGEVLLAEMTLPAWGEVFQKAAAVVTGEGDEDCHAALVATEQIVPSVVGVGPALLQTMTGDAVVVDGDEGLFTRKE